ncbi:hypothetical protein P3S68_013774 [Capsicum galapagoense]
MIDLSYYLNVDNWFKILVECDIKELCLEFGTVYPNKKLPEVIFAAKALNVLRLRGFKIELPSNGIKFSSLRELHLVYSILDEQLLQAICTVCSDLEVLSFRRFYGLISLQVVGNLPKLRSVHLASCPPEFQMVDIAAPNMKDLSIISDRGDLNVLIKISAFVTLKRLKLVDVVVTDQWLENLLPNLLNLEIFDLYLCSSLRTLKISSNRLKYLILVSCNNLIEVDLDTPNFLGFSSDVRYGNDIVNPLPAFHLKASPLLEVKVKLIPETVDTNWYSELTKSLSNFNHSKAICLCCDDYKAIVIPKDMRDTLLPPLYGTKHLHIQITNQVNYLDVVGIVDSLLRFSPQVDTLSFSRTVDLEILKFEKSCDMDKFEILSSRSISWGYVLVIDAADDEDEKPGCASLPWKCWRHELKKVELQQNIDLMELLDLENYFLTNTDVLEIIDAPRRWRRSNPVS